MSSVAAVSRARPGPSSARGSRTSPVPTGIDLAAGATFVACPRRLERPTLVHEAAESGALSAPSSAVRVAAGLIRTYRCGWRGGVGRVSPRERLPSPSRAFGVNAGTIAACPRSTIHPWPPPPRRTTSPTCSGRPLHDLRISVTDRCNFRCTYCMPKEVFGADFAFLPKDRGPDVRGDRAARPRLRRARGARSCGITGGEPLVRRDLPVLIGMLAAIRRPDGGPIDLTLTTNGSALPAAGGPACATRDCSGSPSASTRSTTRRSRR